jgi:hypothetical protein
MLIGNKFDLPGRVVSPDMGKKFAQQRGMLFYETSARTGKNIQDSFVDLAEGMTTKNHSI